MAEKKPWTRFLLLSLLAAGAAWGAGAFPALAGALDLTRRALFDGIFLNLILAFFNLLPIPPLDGSHVLYHVLPPGLRESYRRIGRFGILVLMAIIFFLPGLLQTLLSPVYTLMGVADAFVRLWI